LKKYYQDTWTALDGITSTTTSSAREFADYDYAELMVVDDGSWEGNVQVLGSVDGSDFYNYGSQITSEGLYIIDPVPQWIKVKGTRTAGTLTVEIRGAYKH